MCMKRRVIASALTGGILAVGAGFALGLPHTFVHADSTGASLSATITVVGHSDQQVAPDIAIIDAGMMTNASDAQSAQTKNDAAMKTLISALKSAGIQSSDIHTTW